MKYQHACEVSALDKLFSQPVPIVAACNRLVARSNSIVRTQHDRGWWSGFRSGLWCTAAVFLGACGAVWVVIK